MSHRWTTVALLAVAAVNAVLAGTGVIGARTALVVLLLVEIPLLVWSVRRLLRTYRRYRRRASRGEAWRAVLEGDPMLRIVAGEAAVFASLARWILRRPDIPGDRRALGYARGTQAVPLLLAGVCAVEVVVVHLIVPWPPVRLALDVLGVYGVLAVLGMSAAQAVRPHLLDSRSLGLRFGLHDCGELTRAAVADVRPLHRMEHTSPVFETIDGVPALTLAGSFGTNMCVDLATPVTLSLRIWPWSRPRSRSVERVLLHLDDPELLRRWAVSA